jgi:hypothetical protein
LPVHGGIKCGVTLTSSSPDLKVGSYVALDVQCITCNCIIYSLNSSYKLKDVIWLLISADLIENFDTKVNQGAPMHRRYFVNQRLRDGAGA